MFLEPVTLEGRHIRLEPLSLDHHEALSAVGLDERIWRWYTYPVRTKEEMRTWIEGTLKDQANGTALPFATIEKSSGRAVGSTRFMNIDRSNRHVEIGSTWIHPDWQRTAVNTEAKYLMLRYAFETAGCIRVELKTDSLNVPSRNAILRLGAREEGVFRNHMVTSTGRLRHSAWYSITKEEWPQVRANLEGKLAARATETELQPVHRLNERQIAELHALYQLEWWTKDRALADVQRLVANSKIIVAFCDRATGRLIAFTRVITDSVYKALVLDVIVDQNYRGRDLGRMLMDAVIAHPELKDVKHFELYCRPELVPFYQKWGFAVVPADLCFMRRA